MSLLGNVLGVAGGAVGAVAGGMLGGAGAAPGGMLGGLAGKAAGEALNDMASGRRHRGKKKKRHHAHGAHPSGPPAEAHEYAQKAPTHQGVGRDQARGKVAFTGGRVIRVDQIPAGPGDAQKKPCACGGGARK